MDYTSEQMKAEHVTQKKEKKNRLEKKKERLSLPKQDIKGTWYSL